MAKTKVERMRIYLSRIVCIFFALVMAVTGSRIDESNKVFAASLFTAGLVLVSIASIGRLWCSLYIAGHKNRILVTEGPYSLCRNPLYFFSFWGVLGIGLGTETVTIPIFITIPFLVYYPFVIYDEEKKLLSIYGDRYTKYYESVPRIWPRMKYFSEPDEYPVNPKIYRKHIFSALWFIWLMGILEILEALRKIGLLPTLIKLY